MPSCFLLSLLNFTVCVCVRNDQDSFRFSKLSEQVHWYAVVWYCGKKTGQGDKNVGPEDQNLDPEFNTCCI